MLFIALMPIFAQAHTNVTVAAYLPEWRYEGANFADMARTVNQLILFSLEVQPTGRLSAYDRLPRKALMTEAREATAAAGCMLLACVGGNGRSAGFSAAVANKERRARFVDGLVALCDKHGLDGIDLNWEYPGYTFGSGYQSDEQVERDYKGLKRLLKALHAALSPSGRIVTMAYYPDGKQEQLMMKHGFDKYVTNMHMMAYDQGAQHSTWDFGQRVAKQGAELLPPSLVTLGLPFYGRHTRTGEWKSYEDLVQAHHPLAPAVDEAGGYFFNGADLIARKTKLAVELGLGGVMIWEVSDRGLLHVRTYTFLAPNIHLHSHACAHRWAKTAGSIP